MGDAARPTERELTGELSLAALIREDWLTHGRTLTSPGLHGLVLHRIAVRRHSLPLPLRRALGPVCRTLNSLLIRNVYGLVIHESTVIGRRVKIGHHVGVILGARVVIDDECLVRQNVTLGGLNDATWDDQPRLGTGVELGAGCSVLGGITVGDGARIGPGAVVVTDVPAGATAFVPPARIMKRPGGPS